MSISVAGPTLLLALLVACSSSNPGDKARLQGPKRAKAALTIAPRSDEPVRTFVGRHRQVRFILAPVRVDGEDRYLGVVKGLEHEISGAVMIYRPTSLSGKPWYATTYRGREFWLFEPSGADGFFALPTLAGLRHKLVAAKTTIATDELIRRYRELERAGRIDELVAYDRNHWVAHHQRRLDESAAKTCGGISIALDWQAIPDEWLREAAISNHCSSIESLQAACSRSPEAQARAQKWGTVTCRFDAPPGTKPKRSGFRVESGKLVFVPPADVKAFRSMTARAWKLLDVSRLMLRAPRGYILIDASANARVVAGPDGGPLYEQTVVAASRLGFGREEYSLWAGFSAARVGQKKDSKGRARWMLVCRDKRVPLTVMTAEQRDQLLAKVAIEPPLWKRRIHVLARDSRGTYYLVDAYRSALGGRRYRVFVGRRGAMTLSRLVNVVEDKAGTVFSTKGGKLRLVVDGNGRRAEWIRGRRRTPLKVVGDPRSLVYGELGVYMGQQLGHVCELD